MSDSIQVSTDEHEVQTVWSCLGSAIARFNQSSDQRTLLCPRKTNARCGPAASERSIAYRLAYYLECEIRQSGLISDQSALVVDCEYNRHAGALKAVAVEAKLKGIVEKARHTNLNEPDEDGFYVCSVAPDIIVHERGHDRRNLLVIEVKKASNREIAEYDALKLELFTRLKERDEGYGYHLGAWVVADDLVAPEDRVLRIEARYEGGKIR